MVTLCSQIFATAPLLLIVLTFSTSTAFAQITTRGYVDLHTAGPIILAGERGFVTAGGTDETESNLPFFRCNGGPANCTPGTTFSIGAFMTVSGTAAIDGRSYRVGGQTDASLTLSFSGSVVLPPIAPTAVVTASFTSTGNFYHPTPAGPWQQEPLSGSGLADVYLSSPAGGGFTGSWHVDRIVYRFEQAPIPGLWAYNDIGAVGIAGGSRFSNGQFVLNGSGSDIWGAADGFHFLYQDMGHGNSIAAHVMSLSASQPFAKAGVMLRQNGDAGSAHVLLDVKPDGDVEFMTRSTTSGNTTYIAGAPATFPVWLRLNRIGDTVTASMSQDAVSWKTVGTTTIAGCCWDLGGLIVTSHDNASVARATFEEPQIGLDWPWNDRDIGAVGRAGDAEFIAQRYTVSGSGADIWGTADAFNFLNQFHSGGNWRIVARVDSEQDTNPFAKAGVMLRRRLDASSPHVILDVRPNGAIEFMARDSSGSTAYLGGTTRAFPVWLKLERTGSTVGAFSSADGTAWTKVGTIDVTGILDDWAYYGVAVTSHDTSMLNTASIGALFVEPIAGGDTPSSAPPNVVIYASDVAAGAVHGVWATASDSTSPKGTRLTTPAGSAANTNAPLASPADYVDIPFTTATNTPYTLWIRVKAANNSKFSDSFWVQFSDAQAGGGGVYPIGTTSGLLVNLATDSTAASLSGWGWVNGAYWITQPATFTFSTTQHTLRLQPREYGVQIDQIVLSPSTYLNPGASCPTSCGSAPGPVDNDATIVPKP
jgi:hypothetical protein